MLFWFAGFIALAVLLGDLRCGNVGGVCRASQAATVFGAFEWYAFSPPQFPIDARAPFGRFEEYFANDG